MKRYLMVAAAGLMLAAPLARAQGGSGEVTSVSVLPGAGSVGVVIDVRGGVEGMVGEPVEESVGGGIGFGAVRFLARGLVVVVAERVAGSFDQIAAAAVVGVHEGAAFEVVVHSAHGKVILSRRDLE